MKTWLEVMRDATPAPAARMPLMDPGRDAGAAWQDAISGRQPEQGFADTVAAANAWLSQPFAKPEQMDAPITTGKA